MQFTLARIEEYTHSEINGFTENAHQCTKGGEFEKALLIYNKTLEYFHLDSTHYANAIHLLANIVTPIDKEKTKCLLSMCVFHANNNPLVYLYAAISYKNLNDFENSFSCYQKMKVILQENSVLSIKYKIPIANLERYIALNRECNKTIEFSEKSHLERSFNEFSQNNYRQGLLYIQFQWHKKPSRKLNRIIETIISTYMNGEYSFKLKWFKYIIDDDYGDDLRCFYSELSEEFSDIRKLDLRITDFNNPQFFPMVLSLFKQIKQLPETKYSEDIWRVFISNLACVGDVESLITLKSMIIKEPSFIEKLIHRYIDEKIEWIETNNLFTPPTDEENQWTLKLMDLMSVDCQDIQNNSGQLSPLTAQKADNDEVVAKAINEKDHITAIALLLPIWQNTRENYVADLIDSLEEKIKIENKSYSNKFNFIGEMRAFKSTQKLWRLKKEQDPRLTVEIIKVLKKTPYLDPYANSTDEDNFSRQFWVELMNTVIYLNDARILHFLKNYLITIKKELKGADNASHFNCYPTYSMRSVLESIIPKTIELLETSS